MSDALSAFGTILSRRTTGSPEIYTAVAEVTNYNLTRSRDTEEVTHHESTGQAKEFIPLTHGSQLSLELNFLPATASQVELEGHFETGDLVNFRLVVPDEAGTTVTHTFAALVTQFDTTHPVSGKHTGSITLQISGPIS